MRLRPATADDAPRLRELVRAAYAKYVERMGREPRPMTQDYDAVVRDLDVTVAEADGGGLVGMVSIGDLVKARIEAAEQEAEELKHYVVSAG